VSAAAGVDGRSIIAVVGSGTDAHEALAAPVGELVARSGAHLLTGAGDGVMTAVARAFCAVQGRRGMSIGIVPAADGGSGVALPRPGYPNAWVEVPIRTHLPKSGIEGTSPESRNHIVVLSATAIIALPGGPGTASEIALALHYRRPIIAFVGDSMVPASLPPEVACATDLAQIADFLARHVAP
jgi:uncharacterized protein (TIGR00725 family)